VQRCRCGTSAFVGVKGCGGGLIGCVPLALAIRVKRPGEWRRSLLPLQLAEHGPHGGSARGRAGRGDEQPQDAVVARGCRRQQRCHVVAAALVDVGAPVQQQGDNALVASLASHNQRRVRARRRSLGVCAVARHLQ
jgi:hypothetical protein